MSRRKLFKIMSDKITLQICHKNVTLQAYLLQLPLQHWWVVNCDLCKRFKHLSSIFRHSLIYNYCYRICPCIRNVGGLSKATYTLHPQISEPDAGRKFPPLLALSKKWHSLRFWRHSHPVHPRKSIQWLTQSTWGERVCITGHEGLGRAACPSHV